MTDGLLPFSCQLPKDDIQKTPSLVISRDEVLLGYMAHIHTRCLTHTLVCLHTGLLGLTILI